MLRFWSLRIYFGVRGLMWSIYPPWWLPSIPNTRYWVIPFFPSSFFFFQFTFHYPKDLRGQNGNQGMEFYLFSFSYWPTHSTVSMRAANFSALLWVWGFMSGCLRVPEGKAMGDCVLAQLHVRHLDIWAQPSGFPPLCFLIHVLESQVLENSQSSKTNKKKFG